MAKTRTNDKADCSPKTRVQGETCYECKGTIGKNGECLCLGRALRLKVIQKLDKTKKKKNRFAKQRAAQGLR